MRNKFNKSEDFWLSKTIFVLGILFVALLVAKIFVSNQLATTGAVASANAEEIKNLRAENQDLQNQVSLLGSIGTLSLEAQQMGMKRIAKIEVLHSLSSVAYSP